MVAPAIPPNEKTFAPINVFPNQYPGRRFVIKIETPEFTSVCPKTGLPDFGTIIISYIPDAQCLELKAFKYYMLDYRDVGIFYENAVNRILDDVVRAIDPHWIEVQGVFSPRGGMNTTVTVTHQKASKE